jgi:phosphatidylglycerol:prolipoprotein diacylglycerol transferase
MEHYVHNIDPVILSIGSIQVYWYGLMYVIGILLAWKLLSMRCRRFHSGEYNGWNTAFTQGQIDDIIFYAALSIMIGGRLGSMIFYYPDEFFANPMQFFQIQKGGMSFHGGLLGVIIGLCIYALVKKIPWQDIADIIVSVTPLGLLFGRIGNFINGELWGKPSEVAWAVNFRNVGGGDFARHPSMLYEAALEGLVLFIILWTMTSKSYRRGAPFGWFLLLYGVFRFAVEFIREPDAQIGYLAWGWFTQGQRLCIPMIVIGLILIVIAKAVPKQQPKDNNENTDAPVIS